MDNNYSSIRLEITSKCNLNCSYCHNKYYNNQVNDMNYDEIMEAGNEKIFIEMIKRLFMSEVRLPLIGGIFLCGILAAIMQEDPDLYICEIFDRHRSGIRSLHFSRPPWPFALFLMV